MAQVVCEKAVKQRLKAPATAQFESPERTLLGNERFSITGTVDAQNGFGALLRMNYSCAVQFTGSETYRIEMLDIQEP